MKNLKISQPLGVEVNIEISYVLSQMIMSDENMHIFALNKEALANITDTLEKTVENSGGVCTLGESLSPQKDVRQSIILQMPATISVCVLDILLTLQSIDFSIEECIELSVDIPKENTLFESRLRALSYLQSSACFGYVAVDNLTEPTLEFSYVAPCNNYEISEKRLTLFIELYNELAAALNADFAEDAELCLQKNTDVLWLEEGSPTFYNGDMMAKAIIVIDPEIDKKRMVALRSLWAGFVAALSENNLSDEEKMPNFLESGLGLVSSISDADYYTSQPSRKDTTIH